MPIYAIWTLVVSLVMLALGLAYSVAELKHNIGLKKKEINRLLARIDILEKAADDKALETQTKINSINLGIWGTELV